MSGPIIHVPSAPAAVGGFWVRDFAGGPLHFVDAHVEQGSAVTSVFPRMDQMDAYIAERAIDRVLNAAAVGNDAVSRVFGTLRGVGREVFAPTPSAFWERAFGHWGMSGGVEFSQYFGVDATTSTGRSFSGLVIDDADDGTSVTGFPGGTTTSPRNGQGPGGARAEGGWAGHGRAGWVSADTFGVDMTSGSGPATSPSAPIQALMTGTFNASNLGMGGSGAGSTTQAGRSGGPGLIRASQSDITENTNRDLSGSTSGASGAGSGGGYYAIGRMGYTLASGTTIDLRNSSNHATRGNGRLTTFTVDQPTISGTVQGGVATHFQVYPARPRGGLLVR